MPTSNRLYRIWEAMRRRCYDKNFDSYKWYGAKGIKVCLLWRLNYSYFKKWALDNGYNDNLQIDRIKNDDDYKPSNCRWKTVKEQARNRDNNRIIEFNNQKKCLSEWAEIYNINQRTLITRINKGMSFQEAINKPINYSLKDKKVVINGKIKSIKEWLRVYNVPMATFRTRIKKGMSFKEAITKELPLIYQNPRIKIGLQIKTLNEWLKIYNIKYRTYKYRIKTGLTPQEALTIPVDFRRNQ